MVVVDSSARRGGVTAELAPGAAMAVHVDQPGQQGVPSAPTCRGLHISPLLGKLRSLASKRDPVAVDHQRAVGDDRQGGDYPTGQQNSWVGAHVRMMDRVEGSEAVGVDMGLLWDDHLRRSLSGSAAR